MTDATLQRWTSIVRGAFVLASWAGCVSTEPTVLERLPLCVAPEPQAEPLASVVRVTGELREAGRTRCSGIAVTPRLVLTNLACLVLPYEVNPDDLDRVVERPSFEGTPVYTGYVDYAATCAADAGWRPSENGDFAAWLGDPLELSSLTVAVMQDEMEVATSGVLEVLFPHAASRCWDVAAALVLKDRLPVPARAVRLEETTRSGEPVVLSGFGPSILAPLEREAEIEAVTLDSTEDGTPPRSLRVSKQVCFYEPGGGIISSQSGALIGIIGYGTGECGDPAGRTIATRLAPFRRMLLDAARATGEDLPTESFPADEARNTCPGM